MKKVISVILSAMLVITAFSHIASAEDEIFIEGPGAEYIPGSLYNPDKEDINLFSDDGWNISQVKKKQLYDTIVENINKRVTSFSIASFSVPVKFNAKGEVIGTVDGFADLYYSAVYNNPQSGYLMTGYSFNYYPSTGKVAKIVPRYMPADEYNEAAYNFAADYALSMSVAPDMTDVEKLLSIHDYLTDNIKYNTTNGMWCYSPYGALVHGVAVCQGYSLAYKLLCDRAGLNVSYVVDSPNDHIWNVAELDGKYYHIDVTWDDPNYPNDDDQSVNQTRHSYFLLSDETNMEIRGFTECTWVNYFGECADDSYEGSVYSRINLPLVWKDGVFWGRGLKYVSDETGDRLVYSDKLYKVSDEGIILVTAENYAPFDELDFKFGYPIDGVLAVSGTPGTSAALFSATYKDDGTFGGVRLGSITINSKGKVVIKGIEGNKHMLWYSGMVPAAHSR